MAGIPPPTKQTLYLPVGSSTVSGHPVHKTLASAANLANLLPTGTVLAFETLTPTFSNKGVCLPSNVWLMSAHITICAIICLLSSFTDCFVDSDSKLYYGIATFKGFYIFNREREGEGDDDHEERVDVEISHEEMRGKSVDLSVLRIRVVDFVHAFISLFVFLKYAFSDSDVQRCLFPYGGADLDVLIMNLPLAAGFCAGFFFTIFPKMRRGIGCVDMSNKLK